MRYLRLGRHRNTTVAPERSFRTTCTLGYCRRSQSNPLPGSSRCGPIPVLPRDSLPQCRREQVWTDTAKNRPTENNALLLLSMKCGPAFTVPFYGAVEPIFASSCESQQLTSRYARLSNSRRSSQAKYTTLLVCLRYMRFQRSQQNGRNIIFPEASASRQTRGGDLE